MRVAGHVSAAQLSGAGLARPCSGRSPHRLEPDGWSWNDRKRVLGDDAATLASLERLPRSAPAGARRFGKGYSSFGYLSRAHSRRSDRPELVAGAAKERGLRRKSMKSWRGVAGCRNHAGVETAPGGLMRQLGGTRPGLQLRPADPRQRLHERIVGRRRRA